MSSENKCEIINIEKIDVEKTVKDNIKDMVTTTQIRLLMSNSAVVKNKIEMESNEFYQKNNTKSGYKFSSEIQNEIKYLLIKHIYQCGRDSKVKKFDELFKISGILKSIASSKEKFDEYYRYLEEIVAYVKYYKG